jgi:starch synthase
VTIESEPSTPTLRILFLAAEADPLIKVGGLGDVAGSLPRALRALLPEQLKGYHLDVRLMLPLHPAMHAKINNPQYATFFSVNSHNGPVPALGILIETNQIPVYLISGTPIPLESPVYSPDIQLDSSKYVFFSLAALELCRQLDWQPDILHANDWHTATSIYGLKALYGSDPFFAKTRSMLTVHNLPFMGAGSEKALENFGVPPSQDNRLPKWARYMPLPLGMQMADFITPVSPTYANEILTPEFGCGLQDFLRSRSDSIAGVLNGIDVEDWDPAVDKILPHQFSQENLTDRKLNKAALQAEFSLPEAPDIPLFIMIGRLDQQKGVDLAIQAFSQMNDLPWQIIILGTGNKELEQLCRTLEADMPDRVRAAIRFDGRLARRMYGSADMLVMPSRYEPCGLAQMIAMRYGCIPVARITGGLKDTIQDSTSPEVGTGFLFPENSADALKAALWHAIARFSDQKNWSELQKRAMQQDFSWRRSALSYAQIYFKLMGIEL